MTRVTTSLLRVVAMTGVGVALVATIGCATPGASPGGVLGADQAARIVDEDCTGIPAKERDLGVFAYRDAMGALQPLTENQQVGKVKIPHTRGVAFALRAQPGMTAPWLERVASCHVALAAAGRGATGGGATDPGLVPGATVRIEEANTGYVISIRVPDDAAASEVRRRAQALMTGPSGPTMAQDVFP